MAVSWRVVILTELCMVLREARLHQFINSTRNFATAVGKHLSADTTDSLVTII